MNDFDRAILEYRPRLRWRINLSGKWPESIEKLATEKQLPSILTKAAELPTTGIIDGIDEILHNIDILKKDIGECLISKGIDPLNIDREYIQYYADDINGCTQIEVLDVLKETEEEILVLKDFFLNDLMESSSTTIQGLHEIEAQEISEQISNFLISPETYNPNQMALRVVCATIAYEKLIATKSHLESIESILKAGVNYPSDYSVADLTLSLLSATPKTLQELKKVSSITFNKATKNVKNARNKKKRLSNSHIQQRALLGFKEIFLLREDTGGQIISWAKSHDLMDESSPVVSFLQEFIGVVEDFYEMYDTEALDLFKIAKLDRIYREDILTALAEKKKTRQTFQLLEAIEKEQGGPQVTQRFVQKHKLESPTSICTDHIGALVKPPIILSQSGIQDIDFDISEDTINQAPASGTTSTLVSGVQGPAGPQGPRGLIGPQGERGEMGPAGPKGEEGKEGPRGFQGPEGPQGPQGEQGKQGIAGTTGPMGPQGIQGNPGSVGPQGPAGPAGETGPAGPQGPQGIQGPTGPQGLQGLAGPQGDQGIQGLTGEQGPAGPEGPQGLQGLKGDAGKSAYDIWIDLGYSGTEQDFINSLGGGTYWTQTQW